MVTDLKNANKQLAGFDEMNVLQDTTTKGGGGGAGASIDDWIPPDLDKKTKSAEKTIKEAKNTWLDFGEGMRKLIEEAPWEAWINGFGLLGISVKGITEFIYGLWSIITGFVTFIKGVIDLIVGLVTGDTKKMSKGIQEIIDGLIGIITGIFYTFIGIIHEWVGLIVEIVYETIGSLIKIIVDFFGGIGNWIGDRISDGIDLVKGITSQVQKTFNDILTFIKGIINKIIGLLTSIGSSAGSVIGGALKGVVNGILGVIEKVLNSPIKTINKLINTINKISGINLGTLPTFSLPRLAKGGIINMPGRGVPIGNAIVGEKGQEGVIQLTDSQQMELLGQAIGKYININANIPIYVGNRQIAREMKKINAEDNFAFNR